MKTPPSPRHLRPIAALVLSVTAVAAFWSLREKAPLASPPPLPVPTASEPSLQLAAEPEAKSHTLSRSEGAPETTPKKSGLDAPRPPTAPRPVIEPPKDLDELRRNGRAKLKRALADHQRPPEPPQVAPALGHVSPALPLSPLPTEPPPAIRAAMQPAGAQVECCGGELPPLPVPENEEPGNRDRRQLSIAAQHVSKGDWATAHETFRQLAATTQDDLVRISLRRNLEVSEKQMEILAETDPARHEWLQLELARIHQDLGHTYAADKMWRDLEQRAQHPDVREQAARLRQNPPAPTRPVTLPIAQNQTTPAR